MCIRDRAGRHIDDPQSITVEYDGFVPDTPKAAIVKELPNHKIAGANIQAIEKAAKILDDHGWIVEEVEPPEVDRVYEISSDIRSVYFCCSRNKRLSEA